MARKTSNSFAFDLPENWMSFTENGRFVAQGPNREELILSSWSVSAPPTATPTDVDQLVERLVENAKRSALRTVDDPDVRIVKPLVRDLDAGGFFPCWTLVSETISDDLFFAEAVLRGGHAVMLVTFEAPNAPGRSSEFLAFLGTFGPAES